MSVAMICGTHLDQTDNGIVDMCSPDCARNPLYQPPARPVEPDFSLFWTIPEFREYAVLDQNDMVKGLIA